MSHEVIEGINTDDMVQVSVTTKDIESLNKENVNSILVNRNEIIAVLEERIAELEDTLNTTHLEDLVSRYLVEAKDKRITKLSAQERALANFIDLRKTLEINVTMLELIRNRESVNFRG